MKLNRFFAAVALLFAFVGCENDPYRWEGDTYAKLVGPKNWTLNTDSMIFSFSSMGSDVEEFVVKAEIQLIGLAADYDRDVVLEIAPETTADDAMYSFNNTVVIPAGEVFVPCDIKLFRNVKLQDAVHRLKINVTDKGSIGTGVDAYNQLTIIFSDMLAKPSNWDDVLFPFFGEYSEVKHRFIIDVTGYAEFTYGEPDGMNWGQMYNFQVKLVNALEEYNATHDPLKDENGKLITF